MTLTPDQAKLVERLREGDKFSKAEDCRRDRCNCAIMDEAASALIRIAEERAQTERNRDMWKEQVAQQAKRLEMFAMFMAFVNRWTWGNTITEAEALSCIQYHPILTEWRNALLSEQPDKERT